MNLNKDLESGIYSFGLHSPTYFQSLVNKSYKMGRSVVTQAKSGSGITCAFSIGILQSIDTSVQVTQALILSSSHTLAIHTYKKLIGLSEKMPNLFVSYFDQDKNNTLNKQCPHIIISKPETIQFLHEHNVMNLQNLKIVCIDESYTIFSSHSIHCIEGILSKLNPDIQILFFSNDIRFELYNVIKQFVNDPVQIMDKGYYLSLEGEYLYYVNVEDSQNKIPTALDIIAQLSGNKMLVISRCMKYINELHVELEKRQIKTSLLLDFYVADVAESKVIDEFIYGNTEVLILLDTISQCALNYLKSKIQIMINLELPDIDNYLKQIGRKRFDPRGYNINIIDKSEIKKLQKLQEFYHIAIQELQSDFAKYF